MLASGQDAGTRFPAQLAELRAHRTISASNRTLLRATAEPQLLRDMCTVAVEHGGYVRAGVIFADYGPDRRLRWVAWVGRDEQGRAVAINVHELNAAAYTWADTPLGQDATAIAIRTGKPFTRRDVLAGPVFQDPAYEALRKRAEEGGYMSLTAFPLSCGTETIGALFMAAAEPDAFDEQEIGLLAELADDLAFGIRKGLTKIGDINLGYGQMQPTLVPSDVRLNRPPCRSRTDSWQGQCR